MSEPSSTATRELQGVYVASRVKHAEMWKKYRDAGTPIIASWIDEAGEGETGDFGELWQRIRREISAAGALVFYAAGVEDFPFKGALVEVGIALAMGKPVYAVLNDVMIEGRTMRPVGSWLLDRNVKRYEELDDALIAASLTPKPANGEDLMQLYREAFDAEFPGPGGDPVLQIMALREFARRLLASRSETRAGWIGVSDRLPRKDEVLDLIEERDGDKQTGAWLGKVIGLRGNKVGPANFYYYGPEGGQVSMDGEECGYWQPYPDWRTAGAPVTETRAPEDVIPYSDIKRQIDHIEENGIALAKFGGQDADEGRCRELCAMYLREFILNHEMGKRLAELDMENRNG